MYLPKDNGDAVTYLIDYLYRGAVPPHSDSSSITNLLQLYYLAEKLCMTELMDMVMGQIMKRHKAKSKILGGPFFPQIYNNTHQGSKLRAYSVTQFVISCTRLRKSSGSSEWIEKNVAALESTPGLAADFLRIQFKIGKDIYKRGLEAKTGDLTTIPGVTVCDFHAHKADEPCYLTQSLDK
jgi:hypothetical protein